MTPAAAIPVSVLTGFLGSGKTTILGHLLRQPEFSRTAVIINEFGEIGLDHELVEASEDSFIELQTGCLCCKIRTDLAQTLQELLQRRDAGSCPPFNRVVIETSGLADPAPILQTLMTDTGIAGRLVLGGVVTTVDAVTGAGTLASEDISQKQIALADRIVLTKLDLAGAAPPALTRRLAELNTAAPVLWPIMAGSMRRPLRRRPHNRHTKPGRSTWALRWRMTPRTIRMPDITPASRPMRSCGHNRSGRSP